MGTSRQRGYVTPRGKKWYGYFRKTVNDPTTDEQKTVRVAVILGPRSQMKRSEAREALEREITKQKRADERRCQGDERWFCELRLVRSQSLSALERSQLEGGNQQGEEAAYPEGPYRSIRQDSAGEF